MLFDNEPKSVRESLIGATHDVAKEDDNTAKFAERLDRIEEAKEQAERRFDGDEPTEKPTSLRDELKAALKGASIEPKEKQVAQVADERPAPNHLPKEIRNKWGEIPQEAKSYITKTQKEINDSKAALGQYKYLAEIDSALAPYAENIRLNNVTNAQTVNYLLDCYSKLTDDSTKYQTFLHLADQFGIDLNPLIQEAKSIPASLRNKLTQAETAVQHMRQQQTQHYAAQAEIKVKNWAGTNPDGTYKKKHLNNPKVRGVMGILGTYRPDLYVDNAKYSDTNGLNLGQLYDDVVEILKTELDEDAPISKPQSKHKHHKKNNRNKSVRESLKSAFNEAKGNVNV